MGQVLRAIGCVSILALGLTGCGGPEGFLVPAPADARAPGTTHVEMVVATTRERVESPAFLFGGGRAADVSFADMIISIPPDANRKIGEVQSRGWGRSIPVSSPIEPCSNRNNCRSSI